MENKFIRVDEVAQELDVSTSYAYKLIRQLNNELKAKGFVKPPMWCFYSTPHRRFTQSLGWSLTYCIHHHTPFRLHRKAANPLVPYKA